jgi:hypothetical protein
MLWQHTRLLIVQDTYSDSASVTLSNTTSQVCHDDSIGNQQNSQYPSQSSAEAGSNSEGSIAEVCMLLCLVNQQLLTRFTRLLAARF